MSTKTKPVSQTVKTKNVTQNAVSKNCKLPIRNELAEWKSARKARRKLMRRIFGRTRKSPWTWAVSDCNTGVHVKDRIQNLHAAFWNSNTTGAAAISPELLNFIEHGAGFTEQSLLNIAAFAYGFASEFETSELECDSDLSDDQLFSQLNEIEFPLWYGFVQEDEDSLFQSFSRFEKLITDLLDGDGWPAARAFRHFGLLTASWVRCSRISVCAGFVLDSDVQSQLDWMVRQIIRSTRPDGSLVFDGLGGGINCNAFRKALLQLTSDSDRELFSRTNLSSPRKTEDSEQLPSESSISEWAQIGVLRNCWFRGSPMLGLNFSDSRMQLEIGHRDILMMGDCTPRVRINGVERQPVSEIGVSCNLQFEEAEYVELEVEYDDLTLQRQLLLLRDDELLMLGDNVVSRQRTDIDYRCQFPIGPNVELVPEAETTEYYIRGRSGFCLVLPLGLPEWKTATSSGRLYGVDDQLILEQSISGRGLWAPLILDLNPKRSVKPRTWRRLTVAEQMNTVAPDVAAAYRIQIGRKQWLIYRSIIENGNRTFLGQNFAEELFVGTISVDGTVRSILEIE